MASNCMKTKYFIVLCRIPVDPSRIAKIHKCIQGDTHEKAQWRNFQTISSWSFPRPVTVCFLVKKYSRIKNDILSPIVWKFPL
jgi:hypothetical protein